METASTQDFEKTPKNITQPLGLDHRFGHLTGLVAGD
jgi:hypothetical protein